MNKGKKVWELMFNGDFRGGSVRAPRKIDGDETGKVVSCQV